MSLWEEMDKRQKWLDSLPDGVPCDHVGCLQHVSHPCEVCGRVAGRRLTQRAADLRRRARSRGASDGQISSGASR